MKKALALILALVLLCQALPWTAFASGIEPLSEDELNRALQIAGLRQNPDLSPNRCRRRDGTAVDGEEERLP